MVDIFISYARDDREYALRLVDVLERQGYSVWWDREIVPGESFASVIEQELHDAKCVLTIWSARSVNSQWVRDEASEGARLGTLIPVVIDGVVPPLGFRQIQVSDLTAWYGSGNTDDEGLLDLFSAVRQRVTETAAHEPQLQRTAPTPRERKRFAGRGIWISIFVVVIGSSLGGYILYEGRNVDSQHKAELDAEREAREKAERQGALLDYFESIPERRIRIGGVDLTNIMLTPPRQRASSRGS